MQPPHYDFVASIGRIVNSGQARAIVLTGNIYDLYHLESRDDYIALMDFLAAKWSLPDAILAVYEINGPIRFARNADLAKLRDAWLKWRIGLDADELAIKRMLSGAKLAAQQAATAEAFDANLQAAIGNPTLALEFLRQMCLCSRTELGGKPLLPEDLIIIIEGADLIIPEGEITALSDVDRHRVSICHDWFSDPGFINGDDSVVLLTESRSLLNHRVARLPQVLEVQAPSPDEAIRRHFIAWFNGRRPDGEKLKLWSTEEDLAKLTAGLSIHAMAQMMKGAVHENRPLRQEDVVAKVEDFIQSQLGDDIVEFKKPTHKLDDVIGYTRLKTFLKEDLIPRFNSTGDDALPGAAVCGPIGSGKTYIFEAMAAELDMVVLVLKNIRSQWFGQTDVIFERLRRVLEALAKVVIFVDEADTQFGGVGPEAHETERRLTGKIQAMMSDVQLRGRVIWLLMTARIHLLSPDIRRPGRTGDLIIPVLDPEGDDRIAFLRWVAAPVLDRDLKNDELAQLDKATRDYAASSFASLRSELKARALAHHGALEFKDILVTVDDLIPPAIGETRRYQILQALVNCTRRTLLPNPNITTQERQAWEDEIRALELKGIR
jgi:SpoVK/Ycf46/Vps4 family AAA+-type ATPase